MKKALNKLIAIRVALVISLFFVVSPVSGYCLERSQSHFSLQTAMLLSESETLLGLINEYRQSNGVPPLKLSYALTLAATHHSEDMAANNYFSHTSLDGRTPWNRMREAGYTYNTALGENIAAGSETARLLFEQWKSNKSHNFTMLSKDFKVLGIGSAYNPNSAYGWYWTTNYGGFDDSGSFPSTPTQSPDPTTDFQEYITLQNPNSAPANVTIEYQYRGGGGTTQTVTVGANTRETIDVNAAVGTNKEVSAKVTADQAIVAERSMYFNFSGKDGGHNTKGATGTSNTYYFAEGYTGDGS